jgi:hypothetical protein
MLQGCLVPGTPQGESALASPSRRNEVLRQDRSHSTAANPIVFAAPLLCDAQREV